VDIQIQLAKGIEAAKHGDRAAARDALYAILDQEPRHEIAWVWLSYVVDNAEDREICLENVLMINPGNAYARRGLSQLHQLTKAKANSSVLHATKVVARPVPARPVRSSGQILFTKISLRLITAFWGGISFLFFILGIYDGIEWLIDLANSRTFPSYITSYQLAALTSAVVFFVIGIVGLNVAWGVYRRHMSGYFASIILSLGLTLLGPLATLVAGSPNYLLAGFMALMPSTILFLTLMNQTGFADD
jgi:hypothetical protein